jgi:hypothetical protein
MEVVYYETYSGGFNGDGATAFPAAAPLEEEAILPPCQTTQKQRTTGHSLKNT